MRRGGKIATRPERALLGYEGTDIVVEEIHEPDGDLWAHAGTALAELVDSNEHAGPHQLLGEGGPNAYRVAHQEVALQLPRIPWGNAGVLEGPDPGVQSVDHLVLARQPVDHVTGLPQAGFRFRPERDSVPLACHGRNIGGAQRLAVERSQAPLMLAAPPGRGGGPKRRLE